MTTFTKLDRNAVKLIQSEVTLALTAIAEKYGLSYQVKSGSFSDTSFKASGEFSTPASPDADRQEFVVAAEYIRKNGSPIFTEADFGATFIQGARRYTVTGLKPNRPAYPVTATREDGKGFKFPAQMVRQLLNASK
jgi:hypothetical protein